MTISNYVFTFIFGLEMFVKVSIILSICLLLSSGLSALFKCLTISMLLLSDRRHTVNDAIEGIQGEREERDHLSQSDKYLTPSPMNPQTA